MPSRRGDRETWPACDGSGIAGFFCLKPHCGREPPVSRHRVTASHTQRETVRLRPICSRRMRGDGQTHSAHCLEPTRAPTAALSQIRPGILVGSTVRNANHRDKMAEMKFSMSSHTTSFRCAGISVLVTCPVDSSSSTPRTVSSDANNKKLSLERRSVVPKASTGRRRSSTSLQRMTNVNFVDSFSDHLMMHAFQE